MIDEEFIRNRITELRLRKNVSEYQMSLDLGQSKSYIQGISSGRAMPSMSQFLNICDYFEINPIQFFDSEALYPQLVHKVMEEVKTLSEDDLMLIITLINRLKKYRRQFRSRRAETAPSTALKPAKNLI